MILVGQFLPFHWIDPFVFQFDVIFICEQGSFSANRTDLCVVSERDRIIYFLWKGTLNFSLFRNMIVTVFRTIFLSDWLKFFKVIFLVHILYFLKSEINYNRNKGLILFPSQKWNKFYQMKRWSIINYFISTVNFHYRKLIQPSWYPLPFLRASYLKISLKVAKHLSLRVPPWEIGTMSE